MVSPAFPGMFFAFAGMVLLIFVSVSPPTWDRINFLSVPSGAQNIVYGVFGTCGGGGGCSARSLGYNLNVGTATNLDETVLHRLSVALILHPIAAGLGGIALIFGLLGICAASRLLTILMSIFSFLAAITALVIFVIDMVLFNVLKNKLGAAGIDASLGNANWLTVGAVVAYFLSTCTSFCGAFGRFASGRPNGEKY